MSEGEGPWESATAVRADNGELDRTLRGLLQQVPSSRLGDRPQEEEWNLAQNLAHLGEFPAFFAQELKVILSAAEEDLQVGRTHDHPDRNLAIDSASDQDLDQLKDAIDSALDQLARVLESLQDDDLTRVITNRKYGPEPLKDYLKRYILGHKRAHVDQLSRALRA
ncbi:MAG: DinB family protein [Euzebya sp.]